MMFCTCENFRFIRQTVLAKSLCKNYTLKRVFLKTGVPRDGLRRKKIKPKSPIFYRWLYENILVTINSLPREFFFGGGYPLNLRGTLPPPSKKNLKIRKISIEDKGCEPAIHGCKKIIIQPKGNTPLPKWKTLKIRNINIEDKVVN